MRTIDPQNIRTDFVAALADVRKTFDAANGSGIETDGIKLISEFSFLSSVVLLEGFISDLFVAYINRDNSAFVNYLLSKMSIDTADPHGKRAKPFAAISITRHLTEADIRSVLDSRDYNITFSTVTEMKASAGQWLAAPFKDYFAKISAAESATLAAAKAIRNFLAHRSAAARADMRTALLAPDLPEPLRRGQHEILDVGSFLCSRPKPQTPPRIEQFLASLEDLTNALCP